MHASDSRKRAAEEAAEWWVLLQGSVSRADGERYVDWLRESPIHIAEMLRVAQIHDALDQFQQWSRISNNETPNQGGNIFRLHSSEAHADGATDEPRFRPARRFVAWTTAAVLALALGLFALLLQPRGQTIQTDAGERREIELADGSVVHVDPESRIRVFYEERTRRVFLERGRALFHVAKNRQRPFLVEADNTTVRAVGTAFAVERHDESIVVTVAEGKVVVFPTHAIATAQPSALRPPGRPEMTGAAPYAQAASAGPAQPLRSSTAETQQSTPGSEIYLVANQQVTVSESGGAEAAQYVDSSRSLAWADGRVILENTSVADAVREFNRYNRIQIFIRDADLARRPISGSFNAADPESFTAFLSSVARVRVARTKGADIVIDAAN